MWLLDSDGAKKELYKTSSFIAKYYNFNFDYSKYNIKFSAPL